MKYVLIGCGKIAAKHIEAAVANKLTIAAVCDIVPENMERLLAKYGLENDKNIHRYTDYKKMITEEKPDLAAIATISDTHSSIATDCIYSGINVIIEKPMALSMLSADGVVSAAESSNVKVAVCHPNRFNPGIMAAKRALDEGRFGKISHGSVSVRWNRGKEYYDQAPWRGTWQHDCGALMNQSIHGIDLLLHLMGSKAEEVHGLIEQRFHTYTQCEDLGAAIVRFEDGALGIIEGTVNVFPKNLEESLCIFGEKGTVKFGGMSADRVDAWQFADERPYDKEILSLKESGAQLRGGHKEIYKDMIDAILNDRKPYIDEVAGRNAVEMVLAIYWSDSFGRPVMLPLKYVSHFDFTGRFKKR